MPLTKVDSSMITDIVAPAFSAYRNAAQTVTSGVATKVQIDTEEFDTTGAYDPTTNFRFTPLVAGYYQVNAKAAGNSTTAATAHAVSIYKNGTVWKQGASYVAPSGNGSTCNISTLVYLNGSSDYIELFTTLQGTGTCTITGGASQTWFQANYVSA